MVFLLLFTANENQNAGKGNERHRNAQINRKTNFVDLSLDDPQCQQPSR